MGTPYRYTFALPIPDLSEGVNWTGFSLPNYIVDKGDHRTKAILSDMRDKMGPERFRMVFNNKAAELNARVEARRLDEAVKGAVS